MRIVRRLIISLAVIIVMIPLVATAIISSDWFRPKLNEICNSFIEDGQIGMDSLSVSLLEEIPHLSVKLYNGAIHSYAFFDIPQEYFDDAAQIPTQAHTPVTFREIVVSVDIPSLLLGKINIKRVRIVEPQIYAYISPWGKPNWEIFPISEEEEEESGSNLDLSVGRFALSDASMTLHDGQNRSVYQANIRRFFTTGHISLDMDKMDIRRLILKESDFSVNMKKGGNWIKVGIDSLYIKGDKANERYDLILASHSNIALGKKRYTRDFPFNIQGTLGMDISNLGNFEIDSTVVSIAESPIVLDGQVGFMGENIFTNLRCNIPEFHIGKLISYLDTEAFPIFEGMSTDLKFCLDMKAQGRYESSTGLLPAINAQIKIPEGMFQYPGIDVTVDRLGFDGELNYDPYIIDSTSIAIRSIDLDATGIVLKGDGIATNLLKDPALEISIDGAADLTKLSSIFLKDAGITAQGDVAIDLRGKLKSSDLTLARIGNIRAAGRFRTDNLLVDIPQDSIYARLGGVSLFFGAMENRRDTTITIGEKTLQASLRADTAHVQYRDIAQVELSKARASVKSSADGLSGDTTAVHPLKGSISAGALRVAMTDSIRLRGGDLVLQASVLPSKIDSLAPELSLKTAAGRLAYRDADNFVSVRGADIDFGGTLRSTTIKQRRNDPAAQARRERRLDSLARIYPDIPRDSLLAHTRSLRLAGSTDILGDEGNIDLSVDKSVGELLDKWDANLTIKADGGRIFTRYLPLRNSLDQVDMSINTNEIRFNNTGVNLGNTDLNLTGRVWGIRRAISGKGKLRADLLVSSDTLDVNQLLSALENSSMSTISEIESEEDLDAMIPDDIEGEDTLTTSPLLLIPGNVDLKIGLFVGYGEFADIALNGISGDLYARDRVLQIHDLKAMTEAGNLALTALYSTKSKEDLSTGFDLELRNVQVEKLIDMVPSVDTLVPMLKSFEGVLDCEMAATARLDTNMNILLPTLNGVARLQGEDLVLLDGETFAKVAKLLRFKDRENNQIEQISIEMLVKDNKVEMFPFVVQMDRVMAAASGVHNLDMTFKYHLSVIKSPIPLKLGINVSGTFDDMKFRIGKPLYKSADVPSYTKLIDDSRINLRNSLSDIFQKGNRDITRVEVVKRDEQIDRVLEIKESEELSEEEKKILEKEGIAIPSPKAQ